MILLHGRQLGSAKGPRLPGARTRQHEVFTVPVCREQLQPATRLLPAAIRRASFLHTFADWDLESGLGTVE